MYCKNCGTQLPDDASFCLKCGTPQQAGVQAQTEVPQWETCEIHWENTTKGFFSMSTLRFWAERIGPDGTENVGVTESINETEPITPIKKNQQRMYDLVDQLKVKLLRDG